MTVNYTTNLSLGQPVTGTESGTWGDDVNNAVTSYLDIAIAGTLNLTSADFTAGALTIADTQGTNSASNITSTTAQYMALRVSSLATNSTITAPSHSKLYLVSNADSTYTVTIKASGQTGYTVAKGTRAWVFYNGTDYVLASTNDLLKLTGAFTSGGVPYFSSTSTVASSAALAANAIVIGGGAGAAPSTTTTGTGVVTAIGNNTNAASGLAVLNASGYLNVAQGGSGAGTFTANNVLLGNGTSAFQVVAPGTSGNVLTSNGTTWQSSTPASGVSLSANNTWTGTQTFSGSSSVAAAKLANAKEVITVSATAATGTINYDVTTQSVLYYTSSAGGNWTVNFRGSSGTSLDTLMATGESMTVAFLVTQGATAYYNSAVQVDGSSVTPKYQGGTAWAAGNASGVDAYVYTIVKTGSATFTVFASQTQFK